MKPQGPLVLFAPDGSPIPVERDTPWRLNYAGDFVDVWSKMGLRPKMTARTHKAKPIAPFTASDVRALRQQMPERPASPRRYLSQAKFARLLGVSVALVRAWEQGRRPVMGPALVLLDWLRQDPSRVSKLMSPRRSDVE